MDSSGRKIGERFQQETKYLRPGGAKKDLPPGEKRARAALSLPPPPAEGSAPFWQVIRNRRSCRDYSGEPLPLQELSALLWAAQGVSEKAFSPVYRTVPSAGALHPIDTYLVVNRVEGLDPGIYFFNVEDFSLELKKEGDFSPLIARAALEQDMAASAAAVFIWVAVIERSRQKYRQRAYRYIYLDCGHIAQNLYLAAAAMDLGCCAIAAFFDEEVNEIAGVDGKEETAIYLATVGRNRKG